MARRTFEVIDIVEILVHWHAGRSKNEIAASLGVDRKTIRKYVGPAEAAGLVPGGPPLAEAEWTARAREWFPELTDTRLRQVTWPEVAKHHEYLADQLKAGVTVSTVHQRLVDEHGLAVSVASLRRYVRANMAEEARRSQVTVRALVPATPGEVGEVDYGRLGTWTDPATGARRTVWAFVLVLAASRHLFVRPGTPPTPMKEGIGIPVPPPTTNDPAPIAGHGIPRCAEISASAATVVGCRGIPASGGTTGSDRSRRSPGPARSMRLIRSASAGVGCSRSSRSIRAWTLVSYTSASRARSWASEPFSTSWEGGWRLGG